MKIETRFVFASIALCLAAFTTQAAPDPGGTGDTPPLVDNACAGHLTRPADVVVNMQSNKQEYLVESDDDPGMTWSQYSLPPHLEFNACKRRIIEVRVPYYASSGCVGCYNFAEIHACAGPFSGSKSFEEICRVPLGGTSEAICKTFSHKIDVYKKPAGASTFGDKPIRSYVYKGSMFNGQCRVAAQYLGQVHDTSEVYASVYPPGSGTDVYRILSYPVFNGSVLSTVVGIEFEHMRE